MDATEDAASGRAARPCGHAAVRQPLLPKQTGPKARLLPPWPRCSGGGQATPPRVPKREEERTEAEHHQQRPDADGEVAPVRRARALAGRRHDRLDLRELVDRRVALVAADGADDRVVRVVP